MTKSTLRVYLSGEPAQNLVSKRTGKDFTLLEIFVVAGAPFPEKIVIFEDPRLPKGYYDVPYSLRINQGQLAVIFDFPAAVRAEQK